MWVRTHPLDLRGRIGLNRIEEGLTCRIPIVSASLFLMQGEEGRILENVSQQHTQTLKYTLNKGKT